MSDSCLLMDAIDCVDDKYLKKYFDMKERIASQKVRKSLEPLNGEHR